MTQSQVYQLLKSKGHSAFKAAEIALDYVRGDQHAINWVKAHLGNPK